MRYRSNSHFGKNRSISSPDWNNYHLIVDGKRYEAKHKSYEDWLRFYP
ncbi:MAG: hypothetical protein QNJ33_16215 [Crocosphaera sp.]|nr:hypothetical protein [Crocosphaera sp.]